MIEDFPRFLLSLNLDSLHVHKRKNCAFFEKIFIQSCALKLQISMTSIGSAISSSILFTVLGAVFFLPLYALTYFMNWYTGEWYSSGNFNGKFVTYLGLSYIIFVVIYGLLFFMTLNKTFNGYYGFGTAFKSMLAFLGITFLPGVIAGVLYLYAYYFQPYSAGWGIVGDRASAPDFWRGFIYRLVAFVIYAPFFIAGITAGLNQILFDIGSDFEEDYDYEY